MGSFEAEMMDLILADLLSILTSDYRFLLIAITGVKTGILIFVASFSFHHDIVYAKYFSEVEFSTKTPNIGILSNPKV